jgi:hypothetical protein
MFQSNDISRSREGKDQRSDAPIKDVVSSNRKVQDFATLQATYLHAARKDTQSSSEHSSTSASEIIASMDTSWFEKPILSNNSPALLGRENRLGEKSLTSPDKLTFENLRSKNPTVVDDQVNATTREYPNISREQAEQAFLEFYKKLLNSSRQKD